MQDMLKKIIEMDEQARLVKEKAEKEKAATEQEIIKVKQQIHDDYINRAKARVEKNLEADKADAEKSWEITKAKHKAALTQLEIHDKENHDKWVQEIFNRVIAD